MKDSKTHFAAQNSHGHAEVFFRKLSKIWARALKKVRQPWFGPSGLFQCTVSETTNPPSHLVELPSQGLRAQDSTTWKNADKHPYFELDLNSRS
jgi:hypothetical protein